MWIESHQELGRHPKAKRAARMLDVSVQTLIGHLLFLWWWCLEYALDGDLSQYDDFDIADAAGWEGDPHQFVQALSDCGPGDSAGFLEQTDEGGYIIHDWMDYAGRLVEQIRAQNQKARRNKELYGDLELTRTVRKRDGDHCRHCGKEVDWQNHKGPNGGTYDIVDPGKPVSVKNVVVSCRGCSSSRQQNPPSAPTTSGVDYADKPPAPSDTEELPQAVSEQISADNPLDIHKISTFNPPLIHQESTRNSPGIHQKSATLTLPNHTSSNDDDDDDRACVHGNDSGSIPPSGKTEDRPLGAEAIKYAEVNFQRPLKPLEKSTLVKWCEKFRARSSPEPEEMVKAVIEISVFAETTTSRFRYMQRIVDDWEKAGVVTLEDVKAHNLAWAKAPLRDISGERKVVNSRRGKSRSAPDKYEDFYL